MSIDQGATGAVPTTFDQAVEAERNGHDEQGAVPKEPTRLERRPLPLPGRREQEFNLPAPYKGYKFKAWINYPGHLADDILSNDNAARTAAFARIVLWHNGWPDPESEDDEPLPELVPGDTERFRVFWEAIPQEARLLIQTFIGNEVGNAASSASERRRR
jgi:hypothetical protein